MISTEERIRQKDLDYPEPAEGNLLLSMGLGWLIPGLGHVYMNRYRRGLVFFGAIFLLFFIGLFLCQWTYTTRADFPFYLTGKYGSGLVLIGQFLLTEEKAIDLSVHFHYLEIGILFISTAGLLNFITVLNLIDVKMGRSLPLEMQREENRTSDTNNTTGHQESEGGQSAAVDGGR